MFAAGEKNAEPILEGTEGEADAERQVLSLLDWQETEMKLSAR